jgi:rhodanese-related sulfurtransferase
MALPQISPAAAATMLSAGATLVDIREADEYRREHIGQAHSHPLSRLAADPPRAAGPVIFHCRAGSRTAANEPALQAAATGPAYILEGGIEAWKAAGLPVVQHKGQPIEIMRQVQIIAGSLVLLGFCWAPRSRLVFISSRLLSALASHLLACPEAA